MGRATMAQLLLDVQRNMKKNHVARLSFLALGVLCELPRDRHELCAN